MPRFAIRPRSRTQRHPARTAYIEHCCFFPRNTSPRHEYCRHVVRSEHDKRRQIKITKLHFCFDIRTNVAFAANTRHPSFTLWHLERCTDLFLIVAVAAPLRSNISEVDLAW